MNTKLQAVVAEFTHWFAQPEDFTPLPPEGEGLKPERKAFISQMIADELQEFNEATSIEEEADALVDLVYYVGDFCERNSIPLDRIFDAVHQANLRKLVRGANGQVLRETDGPRKGKVLKPKDWVPPTEEVAAIIAEARSKAVQS